MFFYIPLALARYFKAVYYIFHYSCCALSGFWFISLWIVLELLERFMGSRLHVRCCLALFKSDEYIIFYWGFYFMTWFTGNLEPSTCRLDG